MTNAACTVIIIRIRIQCHNPIRSSRSLCLSVSYSLFLSFICRSSGLCQRSLRCLLGLLYSLPLFTHCFITAMVTHLFHLIGHRMRRNSTLPRLTTVFRENREEWLVRNKQWDIQKWLRHADELICTNEIKGYKEENGSNKSYMREKCDKMYWVGKKRKNIWGNSERCW